MACRNPEWVQKYTPDGRKKIIGIYERRPCRRCLLCRIDRRNYWEDRCDWEKLEKVSSAFVTFTYDSYRIPISKYLNGEATLLRDDFTKFIDRLQSGIKYHGVPSKLCKKNWTFYGVGEYGGVFQRPHYHVLFFGLDFFDCRKLFEKYWQYGIIDSLPILNGGIRYVLKYIDKQQFGDAAVKLYDESGRERPFWSGSTGLGAGLFYSQYDRIAMTGNYINLKGKERPAPDYYRKLFGYSDVTTKVEEKIAEYRKHNKDGDLLHDFDRYEQEMLHARERLLADKLILHGEPAYLHSHADYQPIGSVRQMMFREYERNKLDEAKLINSNIMAKLYEHNGELL